MTPAHTYLNESRGIIDAIEAQLPLVNQAGAFLPKASSSAAWSMYSAPATRAS